ncbi:MAG: site-specific integrase [Oscillospiraceae bacterium]|nr:site-specific integrase [Oscillospiraceae bacterium]
MSRKGENIYKRKDGRWEGRIIVKHNCGKAVYKSFYGNSYKAVKAKMAQYSPMSAWGDLENRVTKKISVDDYAEQWLYSVKLRCKVSTYNKYRGIYRNHIFPEIGDYNISDVTAEDAMNIISKKSFLSSQTQNDILLVIKMILSYAALNKCETASLKGLTVHRDDTKMRVITAKEQNLLIDFLTQNPDLCKIGVYLSLCTGIRIGELCALKRKNISLDNKILYVRATPHNAAKNYHK